MRLRAFSLSRRGSGESTGTPGHQGLDSRYAALPGEGAAMAESPRFGHMARTPTARRGVELTPPIVVAEIGCNHKGDIDIAIEMIKIAAQFCDVDVVKFQKRNNKELLSEEEYDAPHPNPINAFGRSYGEHREFLEFDLNQHRTLMAACKEWGVVYSSSIWDLTSAREIASLEPQLIKVPSAINADLPVLERLFSEFSGEIHVSLGMTSNAEKDRLVELARSRGRLKDIVLYHCVSGYPVDDDELYLLEIRKLCEELGNDVKGIGFSGHHRGISADIAALTLGATYFERHFTLDRTWKGTDHVASLEPDGLRRLARNLRLALPALRYKDAEILEVEREQRKKLKRVRDL